MTAGWRNEVKRRYLFKMAEIHIIREIIGRVVGENAALLKRYA